MDIGFQGFRHALASGVFGFASFCVNALLVSSDVLRCWYAFINDDTCEHGQPTLADRMFENFRCKFNIGDIVYCDLEFIYTTVNSIGNVFNHSTNTYIYLPSGSAGAQDILTSRHRQT